MSEPFHFQRESDSVDNKQKNKSFSELNLLSLAAQGTGLALSAHMGQALVEHSLLRNYQNPGALVHQNPVTLLPEVRAGATVNTTVFIDRHSFLNQAARELHTTRQALLQEQQILNAAKAVPEDIRQGWWQLRTNHRTAPVAGLTGEINTLLNFESALSHKYARGLGSQPAAEVNALLQANEAALANPNLTSQFTNTIRRSFTSTLAAGGAFLAADYVGMKAADMLWGENSSAHRFIQPNLTDVGFGMAAYMFGGPRHRMAAATAFWLGAKTIRYFDR